MKKYMAILSDIERKIAAGRYRPGQKLPPVRKAAQEYECSASTIIKAYAELEKRHAIYSVAQSGFYVVGHSAAARTSAESDTIDFTSASPDIGLFPYLDFQHCLNKAIDTYKAQLFTYGDPLGMEKLRQTLVSHLASNQVFAKMEHIAVTSGVQQALEILAKMPFPHGKSAILVEQPSYDIYLRFLAAEKIPVQGIARTAAGVDLSELEERFKSGGIKFFYTMSRNHNPLGTTLSTEQRKAIAKLAEKYDVYVVEDDYMADLGDERGYSPIHAYDSASRIIYLKSFSKVVFPGLRLGVAALPGELLEQFRAYKNYGDTSLLSQAALEVYIKNGMYERHKQTLFDRYSERIRTLSEAVRRHAEAGQAEVPDVNSGIFAQLRLPREVNLERLTERLAARNIRVSPGKAFYLADYLAREKFLRISVSRVPLAQIDPGVRAIVEEAAKAWGK
ncbi:PLP-dependent aminotransferase family protein [Paenibacillus macerans]|uniref:aminotransferase-like domain-containing protein n=1 Tax=Paenibacillus macerans TaxID=44252 RepID=UPI000EB94DCE|nr:PLP-dependent aminotransferase family protein [Paenibacillus macerans]GBK61894.1 GntR family transcriptional regulator [Paenibacillus macerans]GBK68201.1 GntR family transcriptional regulator [Paenibacillus macerans]